MSRWSALVIGTATLAAVLIAVLIYVGASGVAARLITTSTAWLSRLLPTVDRSPSDVARSRPEEARREVGATPGRGRAPVSSTAPASTSQARDRSSPEQPQRPVAEPSARQVAALMAGARDGDIAEVTRLVTSGVSPNVRDVTGYTPLMTAVVNDRIPAARLLLDRGADINARTRGGLTALMLAIVSGRPEAVKLLIDRGADVNAQSGAGWTALTFAVWKGDPGVVEILLARGAKPNVSDKQGWKPLDYAAPKLTPGDGGPEHTPAPNAVSPR